jgi:hypothetical protein
MFCVHTEEDSRYFGSECWHCYQATNNDKHDDWFESPVEFGEEE